MDMVFLHVVLVVVQPNVGGRGHQADLAGAAAKGLTVSKKDITCSSTIKEITIQYFG